MELLAVKLAGEGVEPAEHGLFHGQQTLELAISTTPTGPTSRPCSRRSITSPGAPTELQEALNGDRLDGERLMVFIEAVDKGRLAQRLAGDLEQRVPPRYVRDALEHLAEACAG
jgi:hypothetical protein